MALTKIIQRPFAGSVLRLGYYVTFVTYFDPIVILLVI